MYWLTHSGTRCRLALLSYVLCQYQSVWSTRRWSHRLLWHLHQWTVTAQTGLLGSLPSSLSCSALWELSGSQRQPRWQLRETPARPELCAQMAWKCMWVLFTLARRCVCESRCYSDCTKAPEHLITQRVRRKETTENNCWRITGFVEAQHDKSSCQLITKFMSFVYM